MGREMVGLVPGFLDKLRQHRWPGNLRELQHVIAQAALLEDGPWLNGRQFVPLSTTGAVGSISERVETNLREAKRSEVGRALAEARGNKSRAAGLLKISRKTLYAWMADLDAPSREAD